MAKRRTSKEEPEAGCLPHWDAPLPAPIALTHGRQIVSLIDAARLLTERFPETYRSQAVDGTAEALMAAAASGAPEDIEDAVTVLRLLLDAHHMTRGEPGDPDRARERQHHHHWRGRRRR